MVGVQKLRVVFAIIEVCAQPSVKISVVEVQKLELFFGVSCSARDPLRGSGVSDRSRENLRGSRATLCGDCACQIALAVVLCESSRSARDVCKEQAAKSQLLSAKVVREVRPRSSGNF